MDLSHLSFNLKPVVGVKQTGLIKPDEHGYRLVCVGGFEIENSAGDYYVMDQVVRSLFDASSELQRRATKGGLRGEMEHPEPEPHDTPKTFMERMLHIEKNRESHIMRQIFLNDKDVKDKNGRPVIGTYAWVKPSGVFGHLLEQSFNDPYQNVAFSIRSISANRPRPNRTLIRAVRKIVTYDWVTEGGIHIADKSWSPALESARKLGHLHINREMVTARHSALAGNVAMESHRVNLQELINLFGWDASPQEVLNWK